MNIVDLRKNLRRSTENRRKTERRQNPHPFGSPEWFAYITTNNMEIPTSDRRGPDRRNEENRHLPDQREQATEERVRFEKKYVRIFLTPAERKLLEDMYLSDLD
jgi:hypothetical protein